MDGYVPPVRDRSFDKRDLPGGLVKLELTLSVDEAAMVMAALEKVPSPRSRRTSSPLPPPPGESSPSLPGKRRPSHGPPRTTSRPSVLKHALATCLRRPFRCRLFPRNRRPPACP